MRPRARMVSPSRTMRTKATKLPSAVRPVVGAVTRLSSLRSVLLPALFLPMIPTTSPCSTLK